MRVEGGPPDLHPSSRHSKGSEYIPLVNDAMQSGVANVSGFVSGIANAELTAPSTRAEVGIDVVMDDADWHWAITFPMITPENEAEFAKDQPDPIAKARHFFRDRVWNGSTFHANKRFSSQMTKREFHEAVRETIVEVLASQKNGFRLGTELSIDMDEAFLLIALDRPEVMMQVSERSELRMQLKPEAYPSFVNGHSTTSKIDEPVMFKAVTTSPTGSARVLSKLEVNSEVDDEGSEGISVPSSLVTENLLGPPCDAPMNSSSKYGSGIGPMGSSPAERVLGCPTLELQDGDFLIGDQPKWCPMHFRYTRARADLFGEFREIDKIRMVDRRMREFFIMSEIMKEGVILHAFPIHRHTIVDEFDMTGWSSVGWINWLHLPTYKNIEKVREYFGEEVAFFFHWLTFYTRWLSIPAIVATLCFPRHYFMDSDDQDLVQIVFAIIMVFWGALFISKYTQASNLKILEWGMQNFDQVAPVRRQFRKKYRGTMSEFAQNLIHWKLVLLFMAETVLAVAFINHFRMQALRLEEGETMFGLSGATTVKMGKYLITLNIKVVDFVWGFLSPSLTEKENWRTHQQLKSAMVSKLFVVKFVVYYYPFFYIAFIKEHIEGCNDEEKGCFPELVENLEIFFVLHIFFVALFILGPMYMSYQAIKTEIAEAQAKRGTVSKYSYIQEQSKLPPYESDTEDFMELVLSLGFVMMFSVALPVMAFIAFMCNLLELKLLAFRLLHVSQRARPRGEEGIGVWEQIIKVLSAIAVMSNVGMAVFAMHPVRDMDPELKLKFFIVAEHAMFMIIAVTQASLPARNLTQVLIEERNEELQDDIIGDHEHPVDVAPRDKVSLSMDPDVIHATIEIE